MSVKKYVIKKNEGNFTTLPNNVLQNLKNYAALGLYCYLASLPSGWEFYKDQLCKHANIGRDKLNRLLKILENHGLLHIVQIRNAQGQFAHFDMQVGDGSDFKINNLEECAAPFTEKPLTANQLLVNSSYKRNNNKLNINNKRNTKSLSASGDAQEKLDDLFFDQFWEAYPRKRNKTRARKVWIREKCDEIADSIITDIKNRALNDSQWQEEKFIPHPSTYLGDKRWEDELSLIKYSQPLQNESKLDRLVRMNMN